MYVFFFVSEAPRKWSSTQFGWSRMWGGEILFLVFCDSTETRFTIAPTWVYSWKREWEKDERNKNWKGDRDREREQERGKVGASACDSARCVFPFFSRMFHVDLKKRETMTGLRCCCRWRWWWCSHHLEQQICGSFGASRAARRVHFIRCH